MDATVEKALQTVLANWEKMKKSHEDDAGDEAEQFEASFYAWMEKLRSWFNQLDQKPATLDEALRLPEVEEITDLLPVELMLNFETELELIVEGQTRIEDERYD
ncbi:hypothetical protein [Brevibacillus choshinensis]|uniref:Transposase n=1 Tax=Brevibacillus choshinensis TaxID=54911 RepID=A0ABX7FT88_BRECH|nr:hypothetical protein [Brevibacillus choshinensis]QRG68799.1 hypothetical protein JNE38_06530 [Brevibacillus choshinensis]